MKNELRPMPSGPNGYSAYGFVRGKDGMPKVDDISLIPKRVWESLPEIERDHLQNIHGKYVPKFS